MEDKRSEGLHRKSIVIKWWLVNLAIWELAALVIWLLGHGESAMDAAIGGAVLSFLIAIIIPTKSKSTNK